MKQPKGSFQVTTWIEFSDEVGPRRWLENVMEVFANTTERSRSKKEQTEHLARVEQNRLNGPGIRVKAEFVPYDPAD